MRYVWVEVTPPKGVLHKKVGLKGKVNRSKWYKMGDENTDFEVEWEDGTISSGFFKNRFSEILTPTLKVLKVLKNGYVTQVTENLYEFISFEVGSLYTENLPNKKKEVLAAWTKWLEDTSDVFSG